MPHVERGELTVGGRRRTYVVVTGRPPSPVPPSGRPLVVFFHGTAQTGNGMRHFSGDSFDALADRAGAVVVYPDGYRRDWNGARDIETPAQRHGVDDVAFFTALVEEMAARHDIDAGRVVTVGFSLGGQMVMRLLHDVPERLAAAAIISSTQPDAAHFSAAHRGPDASTPVPLLLFHGTADPLAPYQGGIVSVHGLFSRGLHLSAPDTAAYYAARNGISAAPVSEPLRQPGGAKVSAVTVTTYGGDTDAPVALFTVHGGGHQVHNAVRAPLRWLLGPGCRGLVCADVIARRFALVPR